MAETRPPVVPRLLRPAARAGRLALDPEQRAVVDHGAGPLLVLAGPGTGKTATLVEAVAERVRRGVPIEGVLVLTFSRRGAAELRARICARLGVATRAPLATTVHAYAYGVLRREAGRAGGPAPRLLSGAEAELTVHRLLSGESEEGARDWPEPLHAALRTRGFAKELTDFLARARERGLHPSVLAELAASRSRPEWLAAARFAVRWEQVEALHPDGPGLDYAELVARAGAVLADRTAGAEERARIGWVFVDEYQDTDPGQERLLAALAGAGGNLVAVGDPDQSIYAFRGADVRVLLEFPERFPRSDGRPAPVVALRVSRRAGQALLDASRRVAGRLPAVPGRHRDLQAATGLPAGDAAVCLAGTATEEAGLVADALRRAHLLDGLPWERMAVLVRSAVRSASPLRRALAAAGVPVTTPGDELVLAAEPASRGLLHALRAAVDPAGFDEEAAVELVTGPIGLVDPLDLRRAGRALAATGRALPDAVAGPPVDAPPELSRVARMVEAARLAAPGGGEQALWAAWQASGLAGRWQAAALRGGRDGREADRALDAVVALFEAAARFAERLPGAGPAVFLEDVAAQQLPGDAVLATAPRGGGVTLATAHRAKGLEWDLVVVAGVQEGSWPDLRAAGSVLGAEQLAELAAGGPPSAVAAASAALVEERRLFYVAVTRARRRLLVTAVSGAGEDDERPSRFVTELVDAGVPLLRAPRALSLPALVGELRSVCCDPRRPDGERRSAAGELARLADAGVPGAAPQEWYPLVELSDAAPIVGPDGHVRVSPSAVETFERCQLRWFFERVAGAREPAGAAQTVGVLLHGLAARVATAELAGEPLPTRDELAAALDEEWPADALGAPWHARRLREQALAALDRFLRWQQRNPRRLLAAEAGFSVPVGTAVLAGRVDRLELAADGRPVVVDLKTGTSPVREVELEGHPQLGMYQLAAGLGGLPGGAAEPAGAELVQLGKAALRSSARVQRQPALSDAADPDWAGQLLVRVAAGMAGAVFAAVPGDACRNCSLTAACPARPEGRRVGEPPELRP